MSSVLESPAAAERLRAASEFLTALPAGTEVLVVGASRGAVDDLVRRLAAASRATFGLHRFTLTQLAARLAAPALAARGLATCTRLAAEAIAARATFDALRSDRIPFFAPVARCPGFARTLAATLNELRTAGVDAAALATLRSPADQLADLLRRYEAQLEDASLADRASLFRAAAAAGGHDPLTALPLVLLDVAFDSAAERDFVAALCAAASHVLITVPSGDAQWQKIRRSIDAKKRRGVASPRAATSLARLQAHLFAEEPPEGEPDDTVRLFSAPGEGRETVEIARCILAEARDGTPFDQMVVFLRSPETYSTLLETAFRRAGIPAYFSRGTHRPDPSGRAFLALLACASDGISAARFAEYLSFGQVPAEAAPGATPDGDRTWTGPRDEALGAATDAAADAAPAAADAPDEEPDGTPVAPWKWEALLVDAAVIGGLDRWRRRLEGLDRELALRAAELASDEPEAPRLTALERARTNLTHHTRFAQPVIERLAALPSRATWGEWLAELSALATHVLRRPQVVLQTLAELAPMATVGPVALDEVREVLSERLRYLTEDPPAYRYGRVLITSLDDARGRSLQVVFVPGLAERVFPQRPREDPLLLDSLRNRLPGGLSTQTERGQLERLRLRLAVGAAERRVYLSYPRVDVVQARPRVTSFYGLDVARAVAGHIPDIEVFQREAEAVVGARLAWPAPPDPAHAIDTSEHDLAVLAQLIHTPAAARDKGAAQYLLELNAHLARSLRTRYGRWERRQWSEYDGLIDPSPAARDLLATHRLGARPYSASALQQFAVCPYRFFLAAIQGLAPRPEAAALEQLDPLTRGRLVHRVQAETLRALADAGALPVTLANLTQAETVLVARLDAVGARFYDDLAPPILRVWEDELAALRGDLIHWLRRLAEQGAAWQPAFFELGFGLPSDAAHDPHSRRAPVVLPNGMSLRGSMDLIERRADGRALRVTDHKTGADRTAAGLVIGNGEVLQPVLYGLAAEIALGLPVTEGRLFFCTSRGGFAEHAVRLDDAARGAALAALETVDRGIAAGFLPPAPREEACTHCDFRPVCGPYEGERWHRKEQALLAPLATLRARP